MKLVQKLAAVGKFLNGSLNSAIRFVDKISGTPIEFHH